MTGSAGGAYSVHKYIKEKCHIETHINSNSLKIIKRNQEHLRLNFVRCLGRYMSLTPKLHIYIYTYISIHFYEYKMQRMFIGKLYRRSIQNSHRLDKTTVLCHDDGYIHLSTILIYDLTWKMMFV